MDSSDLSPGDRTDIDKAHRLFAVFQIKELDLKRTFFAHGLYADMNAGSFREDLFYRLAVIRISLPPLRERPDDIRWLTERLLSTMALEQGRPLAMSENFLRDVMARDWRGNVRELRSYLEQAVILSEAGILASHCRNPG